MSVALQRDYREVQRLYDLRQYKPALKAVERLLKACPADAPHGDTLAYKGLILSALGRKEEGFAAANEGVLRSKLIQISCGAVYDGNHDAHFIDAKPRMDVLHEALADGWIFLRLAEFGVEAADDLGVGAAGGRETEPRRNIKARQAGLIDSRHLGPCWHAFIAGHTETAQPAAFNGFLRH